MTLWLRLDNTNLSSLTSQAVSSPWIHTGASLSAVRRPPSSFCGGFVVCGPDGISCDAASPCFYGNAHLSSHQDIIFFLPVFNNSQLKGNHKDIKLVTDYFRHRLVLGMNFPFLCAIPPLPRAPSAMAASARLRLLLPQGQGEADARAGCAAGFPPLPTLGLNPPAHWAGGRSFHQISSLAPPDPPD